MPGETLHITDEELLLAADGELSKRRASQVRAHLSACWNCRARMCEVERTIASFARAYRESLDLQLPPSDEARANLQSRLAELSFEPPAARWRQLFQVALPSQIAAFICVALILTAGIGKLLLEHFRPITNNPAAISAMVITRGEIPNRNLTPGVTRAVTINEVCAMPHEQVIREVPKSLRQQVFQQYGISNSGSNAYEIDYLITPGLGGVEDIRNLWPEPSESATWNAHVKDALEEHLHQMVCAGKVQLSTAQRDIATDWIAAYKKYFQTDRPLSRSSVRIRL